MGGGERWSHIVAKGAEALKMCSMWRAAVGVKRAVHPAQLLSPSLAGSEGLQGQEVGGVMGQKVSASPHGRLCRLPA